MRMKVYIDKEKETLKSLMQKGIPKTTAWRALKRGYYWINYHKCEKATTSHWSDFFTTGEVIRVVKMVVAKHFGYSNELYDEMVSEGILRLVELAGHEGINSPKWRKAVILNACLNVIHRMRKKNEFYWEVETVERMLSSSKKNNRRRDKEDFY